jgi:predicted Fe-S protein YdhL (DUF1289 family)
MLDQPVKTPCIGVCSTGIGDAVCRGCKRFAHEVIDWNSYSLDQKRLIDRRLADFLAQCVSNKLEVTDPALLRRQLDLQQIRYDSRHSEYCWVFSLLKAGASQIDDSAAYGFELDPRHRHLSLKHLLECIDQEYYTLSTAHYDRYIAWPAQRAGQR